jgi:hypothetical protein
LQIFGQEIRPAKSKKQMQGLMSVRPQSREFELESSDSRLAQSEKCEFTGVSDHFEDKHNEEVGLYRQTLIKSFKL